MKTNTAQHKVLKSLVQALSAATGLPEDAVAQQLGRPPKPDMGDYAFPTFQFAKANKMPPTAAAAQIAEKLQADATLAPLIDKAQAAGPYTNVWVKPGALAASIIQSINESGDAYGDSAIGSGRTVVIDYSAPNIAKPFHVGHLMSTILGASLVRIFRALGYKVVGVNHLGDWGVQCGFQFLSWQLAKEAHAAGTGPDPEKELANKGLDYLADLYVDINQKAKENPELDKRARSLFKKLEDGDAELRKLWERLRTETLSYLQRSYDRLGVKFDSDAGEGFYEPMLKPLLEDLKKSGIAKESEGALVIPMDDAPPKEGKQGKPPFILLKSDEATIYGTRDLAAALYRKKTYDFVKNLYVVDSRQSNHFQMLFKAIEKMGNAWSKDCAHVAFGIMSIKEGETVQAMTTRGGRMIPLNQLLDKMVEIVDAIIREKNPDLSAEKKKQVAEAVGVGAIIFWVQARRRASNFVFDWKQATDPAGDTGPYLQYTHARACSILRRSKTPAQEWQSVDLSLLKEPEEIAVTKALEGFPKAVQQAGEDYEPSLVSSYLLELSSVFGNFLNKHIVLYELTADFKAGKQFDPNLRLARLALVDTVRKVLAKGLGLIGVSAPEEM